MHITWNPGRAKFTLFKIQDSSSFQGKCKIVVERAYESTLIYVYMSIQYMYN